MCFDICSGPIHNLWPAERSSLGLSNNHPGIFRRFGRYTQVRWQIVANSPFFWLRGLICENRITYWIATCAVPSQ